MRSIERRGCARSCVRNHSLHSKRMRATMSSPLARRPRAATMGLMRAMVLPSRAGRSSSRSGRPRAGAGAGAAAGSRLRGLPHRPPHRRRRPRRAEAAAGPGPSDRRHGRGDRGRGRSASRSAQRVGVPWLGWTTASAATAARAARTSASARGSPATTSTAATPSWRSPTSASASRSRMATRDLQAAPLLCAGLIGYRALRLCGDAERIGLYGFGASAHIVCQVAAHQGRARLRAHPARGRRDAAVRARGRRRWAGDTEGGSEAPSPSGRRSRSTPRSSSPPSASWSRWRFAPSRPAGPCVCAGIHMSDIPSFPYEILWGERTLRSVANLTRARRRGVHGAGARGARADRGRTSTRSSAANAALDDLREGRVRGAAVLRIGETLERRGRLMADVTVKRLEEFEAIFGGGFRRVRAGLGVSSFGVAVMDLPPGFADYPEHDHWPRRPGGGLHGARRAGRP